MALKTIAQDSEGDFIFRSGTFEFLEGHLAVIQRIKNRISLWLGEFLSNPDDGFDWADVLENGANEEDLKNIMRAYIQADDFIEFVLEIDVVVNRNNRTASIKFKAITNDGETVEGEAVI